MLGGSYFVVDEFIHELSMIVDRMPRSYLIKQCRNKLNSICAVKPTPGPEPGAQLSFKDSLVNKLQLMVSINLLICIISNICSFPFPVAVHFLINLNFFKKHRQKMVILNQARR